MSLFTKLYIAGWLFLIGVELVGVFWNFHDLDTLSANFWYVRDRFPAISVILTVGMIALWYHLVFQGPKQ
jgi:hypothetical protein